MSQTFKMKNAKLTGRKVLSMSKAEEQEDGAPRLSGQLLALSLGRKSKRKGARSKFEPKIQLIPVNRSMGRPKIARKWPEADYVSTQLVGLSSFHTHTGNSSDSIKAQATSDKFGACSFALADLPSSAANGVFDQYKILEIRLQIKPRSNAMSVVAASSPNDLLTGLMAVVDYDDDTVLSTKLEAQQYDNVVRAQSWEGIEVTFVPAIDPAIFASGAFSGYAIEESDKMWIDINSTTVPHYGVKWVAEALTTSSTSSIVWDVWAYYTVGYKHTR